LNLTPAQHLAATTLDRPVAVTAGPGSGKTRVLVARYLEILESTGADIENIVAITFTKKAASEMRERVRNEMDERASTASDPDSRRAWRQRRRELDGAVITTIHGFCSRLLREHPVESAIDPQFTVLDAYQESVMSDSAAHAAVTGAIDAGLTEVAELVASYSRLGLVRAIERVQKTIRSLGLGLDVVVDATNSSLSTETDWRAAVERVDALVDEAISTLASFPEKTRKERHDKARAAAKLVPFTERWAQSRVALLDPAVGPGGVSLLAQLEQLARVLPQKVISRRLRPFVAEMHSVAGSAKAGGVLAGIALDLVARHYLPIFANLVEKMGMLYEEQKRAASALDFEDLQLGVRRLLTEHPDIARRARARYLYFLVDEYQDTNGLQRDILRAFVGDGGANLFIVGDPKQSIYGFRGAEVSVFAETSRDIVREGGERIDLSTNFRSDGRIVGFVRELFDRVMRAPDSIGSENLETLGFVAHEAGDANHVPVSDEPVVELILAADWPTEDEESGVENGAARSSGGDGPVDEENHRDLEARLLAERIRDLVASRDPIVRVEDEGSTETHRACRYGDVALLLRTRSHVKDYERALRRAGVPFYVVAGKGFYDRPETRDVLEVLRFLDNSTDELSLAAALRSPLFGISDETLLALRADRLAVSQATGRRPRSIDQLPLWKAVVNGRSSVLVAGDQREALSAAVEALQSLRGIRNQVSISALVREVIRRTRIDAVVAAAEDGPQKLSNIEKLIAVARTFERGSGRLLGDFTEYVREFNRLESDEAEANVRADADAVAIMTVHKSKGLEFPVVAIADLEGEFRQRSGDVLLDRELGIGFTVPDGTARRLPTLLHGRLVERLRVRERFESMRTMYVAATRAKDRLILAAAARSLKLADDGRPEVDETRDMLSDRSWLAWLLRATAESGGRFDPDAGEVRIGESRLRLIRGLEAEKKSSGVTQTADSGDEVDADASGGPEIDPEEVAARVARLMRPVERSSVPASTRFAVTSLLSFSTCARRFLLGRLLRIPELTGIERVRDVSERPEPGSALDASLRGLVAHRFCETLLPGESVSERLPAAVADVRRDRGDSYPEIFSSVDDARIAGEVLPLAENYAGSALRARIDAMRQVKAESLAVTAVSSHEAGLAVSEMGFALRFDDGSVVGAVDKLLLVPDGAAGWRAEVIDFKTNRIAGGELRAAALEELGRTYRLQMQAYSLAVRRLVPHVTTVEASLVALAAGPDVGVELEPDSVTEEAAEVAIQGVLSRIREAGTEPENFPAAPGAHCLSCIHVAICPEGSRALGEPFHHFK
jgi:ATP-dependent helicase/nuclease subunit A